MPDTLIIPGRFNGPPAAANGGYVSGLLARHASARSGWAAGGDVEVTLRQPVPLDRPHALARDGDRVRAPISVCRHGQRDLDRAPALSAPAACRGTAISRAGDASRSRPARPA